MALKECRGCSFGDLFRRYCGRHSARGWDYAMARPHRKRSFHPGPRFGILWGLGTLPLRWKIRTANVVEQGGPDWMVGAGAYVLFRKAAWLRRICGRSTNLNPAWVATANSDSKSAGFTCPVGSAKSSPAPGFDAIAISAKNGSTTGNSCTRANARVKSTVPARSAIASCPRCTSAHLHAPEALRGRSRRFSLESMRD